MHRFPTARWQTTSVRSSLVSGARLRAAALLLLVGGNAPALSAQQLPDSFLRSGDRVRVRVSNAHGGSSADVRVGVLAASGTDSLTVTWDNGSSSSLALSQLARLEVSDGPQPFVRQGIAAGFLGGAVLGAVVGSTAQTSNYVSRSVLVAGYAVVGGFGGAIVGGVVGAVSRRERWSMVPTRSPLRRVELTPSFSRGVLGAAGRIRF